MSALRIGIVGLGGNTRLRHVPGLLACEGVELAAVCNRRIESTRAAAREFGIPRVFERWQELVASPEVDAVVIGTWPYLHAPIAIAALESGKHVLTEARMAMNAAEAHAMLAASRAHPELVAQIVPSPLGLGVGRLVRRLLDEGAIGELREYVVLGTSDWLAESSTPLHWRQVGELSGLNMLTLGIVHETLLRWIPDPVEVLAQVTAFTRDRIDSASGLRRPVGSPDSVQALTKTESGARGLYHFSGVTRFGPGTQIHLYGSAGTLKVEFGARERAWLGRRGESELREVEPTAEERGEWQVEADFVRSIRAGTPVTLTNFETGVRYMEFTEAVARSAATGQAVELPLGDVTDGESGDEADEEMDERSDERE